MSGMARALVYLKRIAYELHRANEISEARLTLDHPEWGRAGGKLPKKPKLVSISRADVSDWNDKYRDSHYGEEKAP